MQTGRPFGNRSRHNRLGPSEKRIRTAELDILELTGEREDHSASSGAFARRKQEKNIEVSIDPIVLWVGNQHVVVDVAGCRFNVKEKNVGTGKTWAVYLVCAEPETELADIAGTNIYLTIGQMRRLKFDSPLVDESEGWKIQKRIWEFLDHFFVTQGIKNTLVPTSDEALYPDFLPQADPSGSIIALLRCVPGRYSFDDESSPRAIFRVAHRFAVPGEFCIDLVSVDAGHELAGISRPGTRFPHRVLVRALEYTFDGDRASDMREMWKYLLGVVGEYADAHPEQ